MGQLYCDQNDGKFLNIDFVYIPMVHTTKRKTTKLNPENNLLHVPHGGVR
jgi:hypothetical protein